MPTKKRPAVRGRLKLLRGGATEEEVGQMLDIVAEHPWRLTLRAFIDKVKAHYGLTLEAFQALDPGKKTVAMPYLKNEAGRRFYLPAGLDTDSQLDEFVTASLCRLIGIPPEDFGLLPMEED
jgi:hypothetical protein